MPPAYAGNFGEGGATFGPIVVGGAVAPNSDETKTDIFSDIYSGGLGVGFGLKAAGGWCYYWLLSDNITGPCCKRGYP